MNTAAPSPEDSNLDPFISIVALGMYSALDSTADQIIEDQIQTIQDNAHDFLAFYQAVARLRESFVGTRIDDVMAQFSPAANEADRILRQNEQNY
jgi:hypothetical protein